MGLALRGTTTLLEVSDVRRSLAFYCDVLGFEVIQSAGSGEYIGWVWLRHGDVELMLNAMYDMEEEPRTPEPARVAAHRDTTLFIGCADVEGAYEYLREKGVALRPPVVAPYGMKQLAMQDPDGYGICLQWPAEQEAR
jgi:catechol 2,3-dioxygenase-like lactoylglutathione lyase family enzyme